MENVQQYLLEKGDTASTYRNLLHNLTLSLGANRSAIKLLGGTYCEKAGALKILQLAELDLQLTKSEKC